MNWTGHVARKRDMRSHLNIIRTWRKKAVGRHRRRKDDIKTIFFIMNRQL